MKTALIAVALAPLATAYVQGCGLTTGLFPLASAARCDLRGRSTMTLADTSKSMFQADNEEGKELLEGTASKASKAQIMSRWEYVLLGGCGALMRLWPQSCERASQVRQSRY
jgi:hypothetical protein